MPIYAKCKYKMYRKERWKQTTGYIHLGFYFRNCAQKNIHELNKYPGCFMEYDLTKWLLGRLFLGGFVHM